MIDSPISARPTAHFSRCGNGVGAAVGNRRIAASSVGPI